MAGSMGHEKENTNFMGINHKQIFKY